MCQFHRIMKSVTICKALKHFTFFLFFFFWTVFMSLTNCLFEWAPTCAFLFALLFATLQPWEIVSTFRKEEKPRGGMVIRQILVENHYFALFWQWWPLFLLFDYFLPPCWCHNNMCWYDIISVQYISCFPANSSFFPLFSQLIFLNELMHI